MVTVVNSDTVTRVQILDESVHISHSTNTVGKGMNPVILSSAMGLKRREGFTLQPRYGNWSTWKKNLYPTLYCHLKIFPFLIVYF